MGPMHDERQALTEDHIASVVEAFYAKVRADPALGPVFARAIADEAWPSTCPSSAISGRR